MQEELEPIRKRRKEFEKDIPEILPDPEGGQRGC